MAAAVTEITADAPAVAAAAAATNNPNNNEGSPSSNSDSDSDSKPKSQSETQLSVQNLVDMFTKLNPLAKEFFPSFHNANANANNNNNNNQSVVTVSANTIVQKQSHLHLHLLHHHNPIAVANPNHLHYFPPPPLKHHHSPSPPPPPPPHDNFNNNVPTPNNNNNNSHRSSRRRNNYGQGRRRLNGRSYRAQRDDSIRRTVYVSDVDQHVTEERLAGLFSSCGQVVDCRVCGDPHSVLRFAFVEFADEQGAKAALNLGGTVLGYYPVKVLPSKTAILPVNPTFLPRSEDEREMCTRTVYCTNIDKKVSQAEVKNFFESTCGEVTRLRLLGDHVHSTRIAFVEFAMAESAIIALSCSGMVLGTQPIRVSPSKTPVRPRVIRPTTMN